MCRASLFVKVASAATVTTAVASSTAFAPSRSTTTAVAARVGIDRFITTLCFRTTTARRSQPASTTTLGFDLVANGSRHTPIDTGASSSLSAAGGSRQFLGLFHVSLEFHGIDRIASFGSTLHLFELFGRHFSRGNALT